MEGTGLQVGAAAVSLNELLKKYFEEEEGYSLQGAKGEQKIRCLLFDCRETVTAIVIFRNS